MSWMPSGRGLASDPDGATMNALFGRSSAVVAGLCVLAIAGVAALCGVAIRA